MESQWLVMIIVTTWTLWCIVGVYGEAPWSPEMAISAEGTAGTTGNENVCTDVDIRNSVAQFWKLENCSVVEGFVQILLMDNASEKDFENISFPELREITGYLFLYRVKGLTSLSKLFPNLTVIRGNVLFYNYAFVIYELRSLYEIGLGSLTVIVRGSVRFDKNPHLCYVDTIDWDRIAAAGRDGHYFTDNKPHEQCPNTCPSDIECPVSSLSNGRQQKLCWNVYMCQKVCSPECEHRNLTCSTKSHCCHPECLGGCNGSHSSHCVACRHVTFRGMCLRKCPSGTFKYLGRRCIQEDECRAVNNKLSNFPVAQAIYWKPFHRECLPHCPAGYMESDVDRHKCLACKDRCPKVCGSSVIDSVAAAQKMKGCTFINGSLEIQIQGGGSIIRELEDSLSSIQEIRGYLKIARSFPLISLNFLKSLTRIRGETLDKREYALLVLDNQNLQELWDWENRKTRLSIEGGKIFFHFNSKLCPNKIAELKKYADVRDWDNRDVSPSSNGDRVACNVINMEISVWKLRSEVAGLKWRNFRKAHSDIDFRSLLGYVVYYREAPHRNITIFDGRDACGSDVWKVDDVEADEDGEEIFALLPRLKPFTTYAAYMRTYTIASAELGAQSPIIYFTTKPSTPSPPVNVRAHSTTLGEIVISWGSPRNPNGNVTHYIVDGFLEKESSDFIRKRNYCHEPLVIPDLKEARIEKKNSSNTISVETEPPESRTSENCCTCTKSSPFEVQKDDAEFQIHFEDFLHNNVYIKNLHYGKNKKQNKGHKLNKLFTTESSADIFSTESSFSEFTEASLDISSAEPVSTTTKATIENRTAESSHQDDGNVRFRHVIYNEEYLVVRKLHHFTEYTIEVRACQDPSNDEPKMPECSTQAITTVRTLPLGGADDIDSNTVKISMENLTTGIIIKWDEPNDPNGLIVSYHIECQKADANDYKAIPVCITQLQYKKQNGYILTDLMPGNYSLRLRATSLAAHGNWTKPIYFVIPDAKAGMSSEVFAVVIVFVCLGIIAAIGISFIVYWKWYKKKGVLYASVNPEYMSAGLVYEPDEWEVQRENITFLGELGQGSFGMVYKGEAIGIGSDPKAVIKCAIKTVNVSASVRERIEFLQEASVMKAFNCHHVVKLLGVVSKGHPTLVIMELMGKGDLKAYLRSHRPENSEITHFQPPTLKQILRMAIEIADGMAYLAAKKFVHRDLAARNCMVADDDTVKIGDFGMTRDIYETDYYRKGGKGLLPVRWMAPECLKDGVFSSQSDIWSYGVVLWEMATLASQPYQGLSNEQVLKYVVSGGSMEKPENCPEKLYALMRLCWEHNPKARPTFTELIEILLPEVNQTHFREVSFYFTQRHELGTKESESDDVASSSMPLRAGWGGAPQTGDESAQESDLQYFPATRDVSDENYICNNPRNMFFQSSFDSSEARDSAAAAAANDGSKAYSIHSNEGSKGMSLTSSDGSKGSKVSSVSNGSIANGHLSLTLGRTTTC